MYEIEVKARVNDVEALVKKLADLGCQLSEPIVQEDAIYTQESILPVHKGNVLRIREQKDKILFTLKKNRSNELDCIEKEIEVNDKDQLADIIDLIGYTLVVRVKKARRRTKYNDYEICLDTVDELGNFVEVEKISNEPGEKVQKELFEFLERLGITKEDQVFIGYDNLLYKKKHKN